MKKEAQELGFDPWGDTAQEEFERRVTDLEQHALENPEDDLEILFYEQEGFSWKANASAFFREVNHWRYAVRKTLWSTYSFKTISLPVEIQINYSLRERTKDIEVYLQLAGHQSVANTSLYLNVSANNALDVVNSLGLWPQGPLNG